MIELYTGVPGSGKSLHATRDIYNALRQGKKVIANYPIDTSKIKKCKGEFLYVKNEDSTAKFLYDYAMENFEPKENRILLVIDEAGVPFNSRSWDDGNRMDFIKFFTLHRKLGYRIIMLSQSDKMIDKQIRSFIEYTVIHKNIARFKSLGFILGFVCGGLFVSVRKWYGANEKVDSSFFRYSKKIGSLYDTYMLFSDFEEI